MENRDILILVIISLMVDLSVCSTENHIDRKIKEAAVILANDDERPIYRPIELGMFHVYPSSISDSKVKNEQIENIAISLNYDVEDTAMGIIIGEKLTLIRNIIEKNFKTKRIRLQTNGSLSSQFSIELRNIFNNTVHVKFLGICLLNNFDSAAIKTHAFAIIR